MYKYNNISHSSSGSREIFHLNFLPTRFTTSYYVSSILNTILRFFRISYWAFPLFFYSLTLVLINAPISSSGDTSLSSGLLSIALKFYNKKIDSLKAYYVHSHPSQSSFFFKIFSFFFFIIFLVFITIFHYLFRFFSFFLFKVFILCLISDFE